MDPLLLSDSQRNGIRIWAKMIRQVDEEHAVRMLTRIVTNLCGDTLALDAAVKATEGKLMN